MANLDPWLGPECASAGEQNTVLKIQTEISPWLGIKMVSTPTEV